MAADRRFDAAAPVAALIMGKRTFDELLDEFPQPYLVVAMVGRLGPRLSDIDHGPTRLLERLIEGQRPKGAWAVGEMQDGSQFALHCVFQHKIDADRLAAAVMASGIGRYAGFLSQREFRFDRQLQAAVRKILKELR
jgi:hypothetical protein